MADEEKTKKRQAKNSQVQHAQNNVAEAPGKGSHDHKSIEDDFCSGCPVCKQIAHAICLCTRDGTIIAENPHFESLLGYSRDELINQKLTSLLQSEAVDDFIAFIGRNLYGTAGPYDVELKRKGGGKVCTTFNVVPFIDGDGENPRFLASITDVSTHKRIVEELSLGSAMLDAAQDAVFLQKLDGTTVYANAVALKERGYNPDEVENTGLYNIMAPEFHSILKDRIQSLLARGKIIYEATHLRKDGTSFPVEVHMSLMEHAGRKYILSVVHDLSERKKVEQELLGALKMESISLLAGGIASQFNTLLTHISGNLNVLMSETEPGTQPYRILEETDRVAYRAREPVRRLMAFSASNSPVKKTTLVANLIKDTADFVLSSSNTWCNFFIDYNLYPVEVDEAQFIQAVSNVVLNASQAMPKGGIIDITAGNIHLEDNEISNLPNGNYIKISVRDKGHGISPEHIRRIFDPYFTTQHNRLGLGLSIAYSVLRNHGGTITVESEHGKGSTFNMFLPASSTKDGIQAAITKRIPSGVKMMVVDDEEVVRRVGSRMLSRLGYDSVDFAEDGQEAIRKYKESMESGYPYNIVIVDLTLPGSMGGKEVVKALLEMDPSVNVIISSGYFNDPIVTDFRRYGIKGVLAKPYELEELELILHETHREQVPH